MPEAAANYEARCRRLQQVLQTGSADYFIATPSADLFYLTGLARPQSERLTLLVLPREGPIRLILPRFERILAEHLATFFELATWEETESPAELFVSLLPDHGRGKQIAVANKMFSNFLYALQAAAPEATFVPGGPLLDPLRMNKDKKEIERLAAAGASGDHVFRGLLNEKLVGMSEIEVKARILTLLKEFGPDAAGGAIVGAGANGASPHHHVGPRKLASGDAVVIDFGGAFEGYWLDMTRTFHIGTPSAEFVRVYETVRQANQKAFETVRPGVSAESVDQAARTHIADAGYGEHFLHRTGHGIGLEIHEPPYIVHGNHQVLEEGMTFSIEPGIYLSGKFGVRIEDIVAVTKDGARRFNLFTHELQEISA